MTNYVRYQMGDAWNLYTITGATPVVTEFKHLLVSGSNHIAISLGALMLTSILF